MNFSWFNLCPPFTPLWTAKLCLLDQCSEWTVRQLLGAPEAVPSPGWTRLRPSVSPCFALLPDYLSGHLMNSLQFVYVFWRTPNSTQYSGYECWVDRSIAWLCFCLYSIGCCWPPCLPGCTGGTFADYYMSFSAVTPQPINILSQVKDFEFVLAEFYEVPANPTSYQPPDSISQYSWSPNIWPVFLYIWLFTHPD